MHRNTDPVRPDAKPTDHSAPEVRADPETDADLLRQVTDDRTLDEDTEKMNRIGDPFY